MPAFAVYSVVTEDSIISPHWLRDWRVTGRDWQGVTVYDHGGSSHRRGEITNGSYRMDPTTASDSRAAAAERIGSSPVLHSIDLSPSLTRSRLVIADSETHKKLCRQRRRLISVPF